MTRSARKLGKAFDCTVVSETVHIRLRRTLFGTRGGLFVQCSETDCQYVDTNAPPCPLTLELFAEELQAQRDRRTAAREP